ncbi:hypothetical protein KDA_22030 [Dictyobacter alpinus]|uniref:Uncharacterized protein n=1 Tax=Dictyobacter alpinus TaxID=2014873 RepID=A0A402B5V7_9CHLR|nr:hypothetical protein [Dictyobacter alpinus]GCE26719.1 hypothetical protein KDA_22030 [Dictyobacter alpinus]
MPGYRSNQLSNFSICYLMLIQAGVIGLLIAQSFANSTKVIILLASAALLTLGFLLFLMHMLYVRYKRKKHP